VPVCDLSVGSELLGYRVEGLLGRGGMSVVYVAEDLRLRRRVALKLLAPALAEDRAFRERFLDESELAASLDHPNVADGTPNNWATTHNFETVNDLDREVVNARVWAGLHYRGSALEGLELARQVERWTLRRYFLPRPRR
jgi:serine/threonine protein kinase